MGSRKVSTPAVEAVPVAAQAKEAQVEPNDVLAKERRRGIANTYNRFNTETGSKSKLGV